MCFWPPAHLCAQALLGERRRQGALDRFQIALARHAGFVHFAGDAAIRLRLQVAECQIFQLPLHLPDAQTVRQRRMDVARELGQRATLLFAETVGHAHARQLPCQQDRHNAQVVDDGEQQPPQPFAVASGLAPGMQRPDLIGCIQAVQQAFHRHPPLRRLPWQVGNRAA